MTSMSTAPDGCLILLPAHIQLRRLDVADAPSFAALRREGFERHPLLFRVALEDEASLTPEAVAAQLRRDFVVGCFTHELVAIAGFSRFSGAKLRHKGLLWGMYVRESVRGLHLADAMIARILDRARDEGVETVQLTVVADNAPARRLYERWGFVAWAVEPRAIKIGDAYRDEILMAKALA
jgi:RimJ/RimL family protein N-acetyltransferase